MRIEQQIKGVGAEVPHICYREFRIYICIRVALNCWRIRVYICGGIWRHCQQDLKLELRKILFASVCFPDYCSFNSYIYICETSAKKQEKSLYPLHHSKNLIGLLSEYKLLKGASFGKCNGWHLGVPREK